MNSKIIAAKKAGWKAFRLGKNDIAPVWFKSSEERYAFKMGWWCGPN